MTGAGRPPATARAASAWPGADRTAVPPIARDVTDLIGGTPLLALPVEEAGAGAAPGVRVLGKLEAANPWGSVKDRAALWMLRAAEAAGRLAPGRGTVIEATSGNTGIALAALAAARGYRCVIVMPDGPVGERGRLLSALGAELVLTPREDGFRGAIEHAARLHRLIPGSWWCRQHENPDNARAHRESTGPEIWAGTGGRVDVLVCGVGTGGTLSGTAGHLKERNPALRAVAVEPAGSPVLSQGRGGQHSVPGLNGGFVAPVTDTALIDEVLTVTDEEALGTAGWLARRTGVLVGISAGAAAHAAFRLARRPEQAGRTVVAVLPDTGERYLEVWPAPGAVPAPVREAGDAVGGPRRAPSPEETGPEAGGREAGGREAEGREADGPEADGPVSAT